MLGLEHYDRILHADLLLQPHGVAANHARGVLLVHRCNPVCVASSHSVAFITMAESSSFQDEERIALLTEEMDHKDSLDNKDSVEHAELAHGRLRTTDSARKHGDRALSLIGDERVLLTDEDNKRIRRKTDHRILPILIWVYFLQGAYCAL